MINDIRYAVSFPSNGISLSGHHSFQPGTTAVSGRNGKGKSFIAEMIRYGLFGSKALRGPTSDYKTLDMELSFTVGGGTYRAVRGKKVQLFNPEGEQIAVGADAVNKEIIKILGFGLEVFDVVCAANQKESERLTKLTPAKRKELIDEVVGLTTNETVEDACRKEATALRREAEALTRALVLPTEPVRPEGYRPSAELEVDLRLTKALVERRSALQRVVDSVPVAPDAPDQPEVDVAEIEAHEQRRVEADARYKALFSSISRIPDTTYTRNQLETAEALLEYDAEVKRRGEKPTYTSEQLDEFERILDQKRMIAGSVVTCPECSHEFDPNHAHVDVEAIRALPAPPLDQRGLNAERQRIAAWADELVEPTGERLTKVQIVEATRALDRADEKATMQAELDALPELTDRSDELRAARALNQRWAVWHAQIEEVEKRERAAVEAQDTLDKLEEPKSTVAELDALFVAARVYETQLASYDEQKQRFEELSAQIAEKQERSDGFMAGAKGLVEARRTLKAFLAPSLSRVATTLIQQMTENAERPLFEIVVDEDMNISADGQDVGTFNGAHATMINLALRLALQQVLVSRVFPVFIGDEIDSDLDLANSQALIDALGNLSEHLKQIVVISHKRLEGMDEEIVL